MEAIVPAFLLAVLSQVGDRPAMLTAILADRYGRPLTVALASGLGHAAGNALAALAALAVASSLTPNAKALMLAIALVLAGLGGLFPARIRNRHEAWRLGPLFTPLLAIFAMALGGGTQFFTFALAARSEPWFAAAGASAGAFAVAFVAAVLGELGWRGLPLRWIKLLAAIGFLAAGAWIGLAALRLI